jgi:hypothetical protein
MNTFIIKYSVDCFHIDFPLYYDIQASDSDEAKKSFLGLDIFKNVNWDNQISVESVTPLYKN